MKVRNNFISSQGIIYLLNATFSLNLKQFNISKNKIEIKGIQYFCKGNFLNIINLNISYTQINTHCINFLNEFLKKLKFKN